MLRSCVSVQDQEDDHTGDGDVKPDGQSPSGYAAMESELAAEGVPEGPEDQRQSDR